MSGEKHSRSAWIIAALTVVGGGVLIVKGREPAPPPPPPLEKLGRAAVVIYDDGAPLVGRWVVFHDVDGRVLATLKSGPDGKASGAMPPGGMITVAYGSSIQSLVTVAGVQPNDVVVIGEHDNDEEATGDTSAIARVTLPGGHPTAVRYGVNIGVGTNDLGDAGGALRLPVMRRFIDDKGTFPVLGLAFDADGGSVAYSFAQPAARDGGDTDVRLPAWSADYREQRVVLANAPPGLTSARGELALLLGEERFDHAVGAAPVATPETVLRFAVPRPLGASATYRLELAYGTADRAVLVRRAAAMPADVRLDLKEVLLPRVSAPTMEARADVARPILRWTVDGDTKDADAAVFQLSWPATKEHVWTIIAPPGTKPGFELPALPTELANWRPDARPIRPAVALVEASEYASYEDVRKKWIHLLGESPEGDATIRLALTGNVDF